MADKVRILVVDDELVIRESLHGWLKKSGHKVDTAEGGSAALAMLEKTPYDLLFLDIMMPDLNGYEVCRQLKADPKTHNIPVIFLSALNEVGFQEARWQQGCSEIRPGTDAFPASTIWFQSNQRG